MNTLQHKIDFAAVLRVRKANPNGDPLNDNRPRTDYNGYGEISDVCLKRKIRDRLQEQGLKIFVQPNDRRSEDDQATNLRARLEQTLGGALGSADTAKKACDTWFDVRAFGQLIALPKKDKAAKGKKAKGKPAQSEPSLAEPDATSADGSLEGSGDNSLSIPIRGPVSIQSAFSVTHIEVTSIQITKSVSSDDSGKQRGSDTMGMKHRVEDSVYVLYGSMNPQLASRTGFSDDDAQAIKNVLPRLFENDASAARPEGTMEVLKVVWWQHNSKAGQHSSAKIHRSLTVKPDGQIEVAELLGLEPEIIDGF